MTDYLEKDRTRISLHHEGKPVRWARILADLLTLSRLVGGVALAFVPWETVADALQKLVVCSLVLWTTDAVDGRMARRSGLPASWLGEREIVVDAALALGVAAALVRSGYVSGGFLTVWLALCLTLYIIRPVDTILLIFMVPLHLALPVLAFVHRLPEFKLFLLWVAAMALANRTRLKWVIEVFITGLPDRLERWVWSWLPRWLRLTEDERKSFQAFQPDD